MRKTLSLIVAAASAAVLVGCSSIDSGTITAKVEEPGHYITTMSCSGTKVRTCVPITTYDTPDWRFDIREGEDTGWVYVTPETFDNYAVGDYYGG